jgi:hypothetical protein
MGDLLNVDSVHFGFPHFTEKQGPKVRRPH